ncbi:ComEA family DNA-binding protein [Microbacterium sp. KSW4-16]|uniref:helix-hairpin-helix domain-containing protein n=1 Tax=Microbacterium TaxID=33882 RepID=UPI00103AF8F3|nr:MULTISPECIES: ComEA family DNA-binding protein [Microbacterium]MCK8465764.1 ComEA family DNA-binding protein [Microbacterium aurugineum]TCJ29152.1 ComEA family DNA-binding protein [Microbacterium sp. PI-1]
MASPQAPSPPPLRRRLRLSIGAAVVLGLVVLSAAVGLGILRGQTPPTESVSLTDDEARAGSTGELYVHVLGAVAAPGLYVLDPDARLVDALAAAGGTTDVADLAAVNLARLLEDGEQIIVPTVGAAAAESGAAPAGDDRIDLNTADQAALETLPRIGPALAARIIAWREENGRFRSVDDLLAVPGIGEKLLAGIRDGARV